MQHLNLSGASGFSDLCIGQGVIAQAAVRCQERFEPSRIHIVTDSNVGPLYLDMVASQFQVPVSTSVIPAGEQNKRLATVEALYHDLLSAGLTRRDLVIALGGGVVGDITGFAAATFLRGISLCQIPTTLLAQVDSSVGGKTGVDLPEGKNLVGAFYQPGLVLIDPDLLKTLPDSIFNDGMAEVIKYGCIRNPHILELISSTHFRADIESIILECVRIKRDIVEVDEHDTGMRMILNFGHTIGHAAEKLGNYTELTHGQAVAIGMVSAMRIANTLGQCENLVPQLTDLLQAHGLPTELLYDREAIYQALLSDKKKFAQTVNFILVRKFGQAEIQKIEADRLHDLVLSI